MKVSIIIPVFNKSKYLRTILKQVKEQSFADYECLLIDDGSTDGSGAICDGFALSDHRFKVFHTPNGGVSRARNIGLDVAKGEYVTFIDADDGIKPDYLENLIMCAENSKADLVISGFDKVASDGDKLESVFSNTTGTVPMSEILPDFARVQMNTGIYGCCIAKIFPRVLIEKIRFDEELRLAEDFDFYLNLYETIDSVYLDDYTGYHYLQEAENSTGNTSSDKIDYLAQIRVNLHYRTVLQKRGAYSGENKRIIDCRLSDYVYFVLFYTPAPLYRDRFDKLSALCQKHCVPLISGALLRKWLFFCLRRNSCNAAKMTMSLYRFARNIRNRLV